MAIDLDQVTAEWMTRFINSTAHNVRERLLRAGTPAQWAARVKETLSNPSLPARVANMPIAEQMAWAMAEHIPEAPKAVPHSDEAHREMARQGRHPDGKPMSTAHQIESLIIDSDRAKGSGLARRPDVEF